MSWAGKTLTEALLSHPPPFSPLFCSMVRAAEVGGILDIVLHRLAAFLEKEMEIRLEGEERDDVSDRHLPLRQQRKVPRPP